ncbi:MAG: type II toxin-antitoxin system PemK/MazF family toxin [Dermatophilaceae bacterium]
MRPIHWVSLDKVRPAVLLTRSVVIPALNQVTVAPVVTRVRGLSTEVPVGRRNGLDHDSVVNCDLVTTVRKEDVLGRVGYLLADQEAQLTEAILSAYDLEPA